MHRRVDPPSSLREENGERIRRNGPTPRLRAEHHLAIGKGTKEEGGEEAILAEEEEVLLMKRGDDRLRVLGDDLRLDEDGEPVAVVFFAGFEAVHGEAAGEAGHSAEDGFERLGLVVGDEVPARREQLATEGGRIGRREATHSKTWIIVTHDWRLLAMRVSPQTPMIMLSFCIVLTR